MKRFVVFFIIVVCFQTGFAQADFERKLSEMGIALFTPGRPMANYVKAVRVGNLVFLAGHGPTRADGTNITGKVGADLTQEQGVEAAKVATISLLSTLKAELGSLDKVKRIVKVTGWVNCKSDFQDHPRILNGCSDLLVAIFGDAGKHARAALGANSLPGNIAVEIEMVVELSE
jgi:enamine deaminase RidA (YjgF/YER057c/UK114 family)